MVRRWAVSSGILIVTACTVDNPAFDEVDGSTGTGASSAATTSSPTEPLTTADAGEGDGTSTTEPGMTSLEPTMTSDSTQGPLDETTSGLLQCPVPPDDAMTIAADGLTCGAWRGPQRGFFESVPNEPGHWVFYPCAEGECNNDCGAGQAVWFEPATIAPNDLLDQTCVFLVFDQTLGAGGDCVTHLVRIHDADNVNVLVYAAAWSALANAVLPFAAIHVEPKCTCEQDAVDCCGDGDPGPYQMRVELTTGEQLPIGMGLTVDFTVGVNDVPFRIGNHRSLRASCDEPIAAEWYLQRLP